jgi:hypothetical protein
MTSPVSTPASTQWMVVPVSLAPAASASLTACAPGNEGSSAGWLLMILNLEVILRVFPLIAFLCHNIFTNIAILIVRILMVKLNHST